jgi:surface antigen
MQANAMIRIATRTVLAVAAVTAVGVGGFLAPAASAATAPAAAPPAAAPGPVLPAVGVLGWTGAHDLPDAPVRDDYPWRLYAAKFLGGDTVTARQCSAFALWRIDYRLRLPTNSTLIRLSRAYHMTGAKDLDNAAVRAGYRVDRIPAVGALAQYEAGAYGASRYGHVAFVARIYADGSVLLEEYNGAHPLGYGTRRVNARYVSHYLHLAHR